jgi:hypothetical protein
VAIAQNQAPADVDDAAVIAARAKWGHLFDREPPSRAVQSTPERFDEDGVVPGA